MKNRQILIVSNHIEDSKKEIEDIIKKRIPKLCNFSESDHGEFHCFHLSQFLPTYSRRWIHAFEDIPKICLDCVSMDYYAIVFLFSRCKFGHCDCILNKTADSSKEIFSALQKTIFSGHYEWLSDPQYMDYTLVQLMALLAGGLSPEIPRTEMTYYFFNEDELVGSSNLENFYNVLSTNGLNTFKYNEFDSPGTLVEINLKSNILSIKNCPQKQTNGSPMLQAEYLTYQIKEFQNSKQLMQLENTLNAFCDSIHSDTLCAERNIVEDLLLHHRKVEWSDKIKHSRKFFIPSSSETESNISNKRILLLAGEPGIGKTCFLTNWMDRYRKSRIEVHNCQLQRHSQRTQQRGAVDDGDDMEVSTTSEEEFDIPGRIGPSGTESAILLERSNEGTKRNFVNPQYRYQNKQPIFVEHFVQPNSKRTADVWITLRRLIDRIRNLRGLGKDLNTTDPSTLSALTADLADHERARQLRQIGARFFAALSSNRDGQIGKTDPPTIVLIDGLDQLEDPLASTPEGVKNIEWLFSCYSATNCDEESSGTDHVHRYGLPIVPPGVRLILSCSETHSVYQRLSRCPYVHVVHFPIKKVSNQPAQTRFKVSSVSKLSDNQTEDAHRKVYRQQPSDLVKLLPNLSEWAVASDSESAMVASESSGSDGEMSELQKRVHVVRNRISDHAAVRAYEQWPLRHVPLARKMLAQELHSTSFGFNSASNSKEVTSWEDYRDRLMATQSLRQLIICLIQRWAQEIEVDLVDLAQMQAKEAATSISCSGVSRHSCFGSQSDRLKDIEVDYKCARRAILKKVTKDWTSGFVALVFHCCLAANQFTWSSEGGSGHGFNLEDLLQMLIQLRSPENVIMRQALPSTVVVCNSPLLPYFLLRMIHRVGALTSEIGGAVLRQTKPGSHLVFGHEMVQSVLYQMLARDDGGTGVYLPLESCALQWKAASSEHRFLNFSLSANNADQKQTQSWKQSTNSESIIKQNSSEISLVPRVTFQQIGSAVRVLVLLEQRTAILKEQLKSRREKYQTIGQNPYVAESSSNLDESIKHSAQPRDSGSIPTSSSFFVLANSSSNTGPVKGDESSVDERANIRHNVLLRQAAAMTNCRRVVFEDDLFAIRLIELHVTEVAISSGATPIEVALQELSDLLCDPRVLLCIGWPEYKEQPFLGTIANAHLIVSYLKFTQRAVVHLKRPHFSNLSPSSHTSDPDAKTISSPLSATSTWNSVGNQETQCESDQNTIEDQIYLIARNALALLRNGCLKKNGLGDVESLSSGLTCMKQVEKLEEINAFQIPKALESFVWICGELLYLLGKENESITILSELAQTLVRRQILDQGNLLQLAHLGMNLALKRRILLPNNKRWLDDLLSLINIIEVRIGNEMRGIQSMNLVEFIEKTSTTSTCETMDRGDNRLPIINLQSAYAYMKLFRIEAALILFAKKDVKPMSLLLNEADKAFLSIFETDRFNECVALTATVRALSAHLNNEKSQFEREMLEAIRLLILDQGIFDPRLVEWLLSLSRSLQEPDDEAIPDEASFLRLASRRIRAESCIRWALNIIRQNRTVTVRPPGHPPTHVMHESNDCFDYHIHKSLLQRLPRFLMYITNQGYCKRSNRSFHREPDDPAHQDFKGFTLKLFADMTDTEELNDADCFATRIRLSLTECLLEDGRLSSLQEAINHISLVLHERVALLGVEHPITINTHEWLRFVEMQLTQYNTPGHASTVVARAINRRNAEARMASTKPANESDSLRSKPSDNLVFNNMVPSPIHGLPFEPSRMVQSLDRTSMRESTKNKDTNVLATRFPIQLESNQWTTAKHLTLLPYTNTPPQKKKEIQTSFAYTPNPTVLKPLRRASAQNRKRKDLSARRFVAENGSIAIHSITYGTTGSPRLNTSAMSGVKSASAR